MRPEVIINVSRANSLGDLFPQMAFRSAPDDGFQKINFPVRGTPIEQDNGLEMERLSEVWEMNDARPPIWSL